MHPPVQSGEGMVEVPQMEETAYEEGGPIMTEEGWKREYSRLQKVLGTIGRDEVNQGKDPLLSVDYQFALGELNIARKQVIAHTTANAIRHLFEE